MYIYILSVIDIYIYQLYTAANRCHRPQSCKWLITFSTSPRNAFDSNLSGVTRHLRRFWISANHGCYSGILSMKDIEQIHKKF